MSSQSGNFWAAVMAIIGVAMVTVVVSSPTAATNIMAMAQGFSGVLSAAMGGGQGGR